MKRDSFILHIDSLSILDKMTDEFAGQFIKTIYKYQKTRVMPEMDFAMQMATEQFLNQFNRDDASYLKSVEKNRKNGAKGGRPKLNPEEPKKPTGFNKNPEEPKKPDSDSDSVNESEKKKKQVPTKSEKDFSEECIKIYEWCLKFFDKRNIPNTPSKVIAWKDEIRKLLEIDKYDKMQVCEVIKYGRTDVFWKTNFLSIRSIRKKTNDVSKFENMKVKMLSEREATIVKDDYKPNLKWLEEVRY